jgi:serine/alanine racemase
MAVLKADAYGHGAVEVSRALRVCGVSSFAVAALSEGIALRRAGIKGDILVLGYTQPAEAALLRRFKLAQTVVDGAYADALHETGVPLDVHVKIDTGMHRLGVDSGHIPEIERIFSYRTLTVRGMFTHLSRADDLSGTAVDFSLDQISRFADAVGKLRSKGYAVGALHIQGSYGILNYPGTPGDYARAGIALYGVLSRNGRTLLSPRLMPALALRARIAEVKRIAKGESVGYGSSFIAENPMKIAVVTIGYADGIPRNPAPGKGCVLVGGRKAPIVGLVCMDLLAVDVTGIEQAGRGDIVTLIGDDGDAFLRCEDVAESCGTITNELLSRLGARLPRVYI